jgi:4-amino-4-deoxy-L-arabinose transferase-like glycosyltransferase
VSSALAAGLVAQNWLTPLGASRAYSMLPKGHAALGFGLFLVAGLVAAAALWLDDEAPEERRGATRATPKRAPTGALLYAAVALVALASGLSYLDVESPLAIYPWGAGLVLLGVAAWRRDPPSPVTADRMTALGWAALLLVIAVAVAWRLPGLAEIPPQVHGDEAACGLEARRILHGEVPNLLGLGWYDIPYPSFALSALFMTLFGDDLFGLRMGSVVLGVASVGLLFLAARRLYGLRCATIAALLLAMSHWHVHFSRIGTDYMQACFAAMLALFFFVRARQDGRWLDWVIAGLAVGLSCSVYYAGRAVILVLAAFLVVERLCDGAAERRRSQGLTAMVLAAVMFVAPTYAVTARLPSALTDRSRGVFVLSEHNLEHSFGGDGERDVPRLLVEQAAKSLAAFNWRGERSDQHSHAAPLLDFWSGAVFAVALVALTALGWKRRYRLVVLWFWVNLVAGSILTVDAMFSPRMVVALPMVFVLPALLLDRWLESARRAGGVAGVLALAAIALFLPASALGNYADYFDLHVNRLQIARRPTLLARFVREVNADDRVYVYGRISLGYDTPRFLVPDVDGADMGTGTALPPPAEAAGKGIAVVVDAEWEGGPALLAAVEDAHPDALHSRLHLADGRVAFEVLRWR